MVILGKKYNYDDIMSEVHRLKEEYEGTVEMAVIGQSYDGRDIPMLRIGNLEKYLVISGGVHGRESTNPVVLLRMLEDYAIAYRKGRWLYKKYSAGRLLKNCGICLIPILNPDGYEIALNGFESIRNENLREKCQRKKLPAEEWKYNGRGIDINRNFPCKSYQAVNHGDFALSEKETRALSNVFHDYSTMAYLDIHSRGKLIYYHRKAMPFFYNMKSKKIAKQMRYVSGYRLGRIREEFLDKSSGGNTVNYYSEFFAKPAITVETVADEAQFPIDISYQQEVYGEIREIPAVVLSCFFSSVPL